MKIVIKSFRDDDFWVGLKLQIGSPWSDGTEGVTQCPILPGETFTYRFVVDRVSPHTQCQDSPSPMFMLALLNRKIMRVLRGSDNFWELVSYVPVQPNIFVTQNCQTTLVHT